MADETTVAGDDASRRPLRDANGDIDPAFVLAMAEATKAGDAGTLKRDAGALDPPDMAELVEALEPELRPAFVTLLGDAFDFTALTELDEAPRLQILTALPIEIAARGIRDLESDDAVYILEDLDTAHQAAILARIPALERAALERGLDYPENSAGRRMQTDFIAVPPFWSIGQTIDYMRSAADLPEDFYEVFVVDAAYRLVGMVALNRLLRARREVKIAEIMEETQHFVRATDDQEEVARLFERYDLISTAVVDAAGRLVGVITVDDVVDVIQEEADEDMRKLGGVGDEEVSDSVLTTARLRLPWLLINLLTACVAASVVAAFEDTIKALVTLAILMPVNAALGGNAGTQALTVAVRALATRDLRASNKSRVVLREAGVGLINGAVLAAIAGTAVTLIFGNPLLGVVLASALVGTVLFATLLGIVVPLTLDRIGVDPAVASGVFVTTAADIFGFFCFLGLATLLIAFL